MIPFILLIFFSILMFAIQISFVITTNAQSPFSAGELVGVILLSIGPGIAIILLIVLLAYLTYFHLILGMTTYEYLLHRAEQKNQAEIAADNLRWEKRRKEIEKEQEELRQEWLRNREKEMAKNTKPETLPSQNRSLVTI